MVSDYWTKNVGIKWSHDWSGIQVITKITDLSALFYWSYNHLAIILPGK